MSGAWSECHLCGRLVPPEQDVRALVFCSPGCYGRWTAARRRAALTHPDTDPSG